MEESEQKKEVFDRLIERIKKRSGLFYRITEFDDQQLTVEDLLTQAVEILPGGWPNPEFTSVIIEYAGTAYTKGNYREAKWVISAEKLVRNNDPLLVKVTHSDKQESLVSSPFEEDDRNLVYTITTQLALKIERILSRKELDEAQRLLDKSYKLARIGTWEFDMTTHKLTWSSVTKEVHGFDEDYQPDVESTINLFKEGYNREKFAKAANDAIEKEIPFDVELKIISGKGDERWIRATGEPEYKNGICTRFYGISQNVTDRKRAEEDIQLNEQRFKALVQNGSDLIAILDADLRITYVSPASKRLLGMSPEEYIGKKLREFIHEDDKERILDGISSLLLDQSLRIQPYRVPDADGNWRWLESIITNMTDAPAVGGFVVNSRDITERKLHQEQILESLKEKETLLAEIHHRVKNNLAVITGLLQLQAGNEKNPEVINRLYDSIARVHTMANIHEQLYQTNSFSKLEFAENIRLLTMNILNTFQPETDVKVDFQCKPISLNMYQALPCSLIVNEIITNILKHAFTGRNKGEIVISLSTLTCGEQINLTIQDNGIGLPENFGACESGSLGLTLIDVLSQQLEAAYNYQSNGEGTIFTLNFSKFNKTDFGVLE